MNERIEKMMLEATKDIPQGYYVPPQYFEKFAELIVRECMDIARQVGNISDPEDFALDRCYEIEQKIQDRFGVEE